MDGLGLPRFDSPACLAALLGNTENGRWLIAPYDTASRAKRRYLGDTLILETMFETETGTVCVVDCPSRCVAVSDVVRPVRGVSGRVAMRTGLIGLLRLWLGGAVGDAAGRRPTSDGSGRGSASAQYERIPWRRRYEDGGEFDVEVGQADVRRRTHRDAWPG
jgi:hypothetical protein